MNNNKSLNTTAADRHNEHINIAENTQRLDVILPCYRPPGNWITILADSYKALSDMLTHWHIRFIIINDGDKTISDAQITQLKTQIPTLCYINQTVNQGKGSAIRRGIQIADAPFIMYTDIEFPYQYSSIVQLLECISQRKTDIVCGQRSAVNTRLQSPLSRRFISTLLMTFNRLFISTTVIDTQCGLKIMNQQAKSILLQTTTNRYMFDLEFILKAESHPNIRLSSQRVLMSERVSFSQVHIRTLIAECFSLIQILKTHTVSQHEKSRS